MPSITLPDGSQRSFDNPISVHDVAADIGPGLAKAALAGVVDGREVDTSHLLEQDATLAIITDRDDAGLEVIRHSTAHLLAMATQELFPGVQVTIGPVIEDGFFYDFAYEKGFNPDDLAAIEKRMKELVKQNIPVERSVMSREEAITFFSDMGEAYKAEIIESIPTGEGGAVLTNRADVCERLLSLRNHGFRHGTHVQTELGFNFRLTEMQAALGLSQLDRLDEFIEKRKRIAAFYTEALDTCVSVPIFNEDSAHHLFVIRTPRRDELRQKLAERDIMTQVHYTPIHLQPYWAGTAYSLEGAESYAEEALTLPIYPTLTINEQELIVNSVMEAMA